MVTDMDLMDLDDLGVPEADTVSECVHCGVHPEVSPIDGTTQLFHYDNCFLMNPDNFLVAA